MENAAKALLMAGGTLIAILIMSLAIYLFITFGQDAKMLNERIDDTQLLKFNSQFNVYFDRKNLKVHDVISVVNLAQENNEFYKNYSDFAESYKITVYVLYTTYTPNAIQWNEDTKQNFMNYYSEIENSTGNIKYTFSCIGKNALYHSNGRIKELYFGLNT